MYQILGSDGKEYGPVDAGQLREWIRQGRAGGITQVQRVGESAWAPLRALPEFADTFQTPPPRAGSSPGTLPPVVRTFGLLNLVVAALSLLLQAGSLVSLMQAVSHATNFSPFTGTFILFQALGLVGVTIRVVSGIGLLRGREWARQLAVYYAAFAILLGLYGLGQTMFAMASAGAMFSWFRSMSFLLHTGFSVLLLLFNGATVVLLSRRAVRTVLGGK